MAYTKPFSELSMVDVSIAGGKGASLGEMTGANIPVPDGFVILSTAFDEFLKETDLNVEIDSHLHNVNIDSIHTVEEASAQIGRRIERAEMPKEIAKEILNSFDSLGSPLVAVRSSATSEDSSAAAWAGQLDSHMNIEREEVLKKVQECWASLFTPRAIFYRFEKGLHKERISVAVVVQKMVNSEVAGIGFSVHPVTEDHNQIIIEAGYGFGDAIVSGSITPDSYVVEKSPEKILDINVSKQENKLVRREKEQEPDPEWGENVWKDVPEAEQEKQKLTNEQILELGILIQKIESHYGFPVDTEWALEKGKFYITQSRPITTLTNRAVKNTELKDKEMVPIGLRRAGVHESSLKVLGMSKVWERELGVGYKTCVMNSSGESFGDKESHHKINEAFEKKSLDDAKAYVKKLYDLRDSVDKEFAKTPNKDFTNDFANMMGYFFLIKDIFESAYENSSDEDKKFIEKWRNDEKIFEPLDKFYEKYPEKDKSDGEWSWVFENGKLNFYDRVISLERNDKNKINQKITKFQEEKVITGQSAYPGLVVASVRIISTKKDKSLLKEGEVIVAKMTTVDFLPIMKKASAFVTDEGGITSHASIIARELKKPCIIGTKIATQVLKDGMEVEVDANEGVVRILGEK